MKILTRKPENFVFVKLKEYFWVVLFFFFFKKIKTKIIDIREKLSTSEIKMFIRIKVRSMGYLSVHW